MQMKKSQLHFWSYYSDFFTFPAMIFMTIAAVIMVNIPSLCIGWFVSGLALWSLFEYVFHRWGFHQFIFARAHHLHHIDPAGYIGVSSLLTSTIYVFGISLSLSLSMPAMAILQVGLANGYLAYIFVHHQIHHGRLTGHYLDAARTRHTRHHRNARGNFGVTVSLWDRILGTRSANY
jgi:sterol desaturase/sphingolipid hydroxylase (fatty acid hydroxylase superfamily)